MAFSGNSRPPRKARPRISLKMQAIGYLSRREHSRQELRDKLLASLRRRAREEAEAELVANGDAAGEANTDALRDLTATADTAGIANVQAPVGCVDTPAEVLEHDDPEAAVDCLLDWLATHDYLSDERFVDSRVHARAGKQGLTRIRHELARHGLALAPAHALGLRETEFARAQALWQRKFGEVATDARVRARQARFLTARGFASDIVRRLVGGGDED